MDFYGHSESEKFVQVIHLYKRFTFIIIRMPRYIRVRATLRFRDAQCVATYVAGCIIQFVNN